jgi:hypothetical protein
VLIITDVGVAGAVADPYEFVLIHGPTGAAAQLPNTVWPPEVAVPVTGCIVLIMIDPAPFRTCIRISEGYEPASVRYTLIVDPTDAVNVEFVGPNPTQLKLDKTVTPLTETATVPPFQPSPKVSVRRIVCVHDCE